MGVRERHCRLVLVCSDAGGTKGSVGGGRMPCFRNDEFDRVCINSWKLIDPSFGPI